MKQAACYISCQLLLASICLAQLPSEGYFNGYEESVGGFAFTYTSPLPDVNASLLVRAHEAYDPIVWETEAVPADYDKPYARFIWAYGLDTDPVTRLFSLYVNNTFYLTFPNPATNDQDNWTVEGKDGSSLTFNATVIDRNNDQLGFAVLALPSAAFNPGHPVVVKIDGADVGSDRWYMTFKAEIRERSSIEQENVVVRDSGELFHVARFEHVRIGGDVGATFSIGDIDRSVELKPGFNSADILLPKVEQRTEHTATISIGNEPAIELDFELKPVKEWTVYLVQHSHTDIGYTRPQTEILPEHLRYIDYALDYCDQTDGYPEPAQFRWTCEASWAVREYLKSRPQDQIDRLVGRIDEGRIEVTGMFFNYSEIVDEPGLAAQTRTLKTFADRGIDVTTAMQNDVNGIGWCMPDYFNNTGVKYLIMGQHGHRARIPFDRPTAFWWEAPSGNRLLAYRAEHYMHGNMLGLTGGDLNSFEKHLARYLDQLEAKGYPYSRTAFQYSGYLTDNAPPSTMASDLVRSWNERYEWPKLRVALAGEFMQYLEDNHADDLAVHREAWPDWWTDGFGSAMRETQASRTTQSEMIANTGLLAMADLLGDGLGVSVNEEISTIRDALLFYDEHTYGAAESIYDPLDENVAIQWSEKSSYAWEAVKRSRMLTEKAMGYLQPHLGKADVPSIAVFNTLNWQRSGLVTVYIDHEILPNDRAFQILDSEGKEAAVQALESRSDGTYWAIWAENIPPLGYKMYRILAGKKPRLEENLSEVVFTLENDFYRIEVDPESAEVTDLFDKDLQQSLLDSASGFKMGEFIYERLANRYQLERFTNQKIDTVYVPLKGEQFSLQNIEITQLKAGPVWMSLYLRGEMPGCADDRGIEIEIRLYNRDKRIELHYGMHKLPVTEPEAVYVAFPFHLDNGELNFEAQGGIVSPGENQLEGTAADWNTIQNFASVRNDDTQIVFGSNDIPLVQFGAINTGRYYYKHRPETNHIYSWVLNNYWTTNFRASQEGEMNWSYHITSSDDTSNAFATRFGWESRIPMMTRVLPAGQEDAADAADQSRSLLDLDVPSLLLVAAQPSTVGNGIILHLREVDGEVAELNIDRMVRPYPYHTVAEVDILENQLAELEDTISFDPFEVKFLKLFREGN